MFCSFDPGYTAVAKYLRARRSPGTEPQCLRNLWRHGRLASGDMDRCDPVDLEPCTGLFRNSILWVHEQHRQPTIGSNCSYRKRVCELVIHPEHTLRSNDYFHRSALSADLGRHGRSIGCIARFRSHERPPNEHG